MIKKLLPIFISVFVISVNVLCADARQTDAETDCNAIMLDITETVTSSCGTERGVSMSKWPKQIFIVEGSYSGHYTVIGVIGSRRKIAGVTARLKEEYGFSDADFERVTSPIGLAIRAETPEEIAVSIAAQLIALRAERSGRR